MKKYELTDELIEVEGKKLYRIKALVDIPKHDVKIGELGGFVENEKNLSHEYNAWVTGNARVIDNAIVGGDAIVGGKAIVGGNARVIDNAIVGGNAWVTGDAWVSDNVRVTDKAIVTDNAIVGGNARVIDNAIVGGNADYIVIYPIGSECGVFTAYRTENGIGCNRGCFSGTVEEFEEAVKKTHDENKFAKEYKKVIELVKLRLGKLNDE